MDKFGEIRSGINSDREEKSGAEGESGRRRRRESGRRNES